MKLSSFFQKITGCTLLIMAMHICGADSTTRMQTFRDMAAQAASLGWQGAAYTGQKAAEFGRFVYPSLKTSAQIGSGVIQDAAPYVQTALKEANPYVQAGAQKLRQVGQAIDVKTSGLARQAVGYIAEYKWPDMTNKLATIQSTLYRLSSTMRGLNQTFYSLLQVLPPEKIDEIRKKAGLIPQVVCPPCAPQPTTPAAAP